MSEQAGNLWDELFKVSPVHYKKPVATLYDLFRNNADLALVKQYVDAGHATVKASAGSDPLSYAVKFCDLPIIRYLLDVCPVVNAAGLCDMAIKRISESIDDPEAAGKSLDAGLAVLDLLLQQFPEQQNLASAYASAAILEEYTTAKRILAAGLRDEPVRIGAKSWKLLSEKLRQLRADTYADLLLGKPVDEESLMRNEVKNRRQAAHLQAAMQELVPFNSIVQLEGEARAVHYARLADEIREGLWDTQLARPDPHFHRSVIEFAAQNNLLELWQSLQTRAAVFRDLKKQIKKQGYAAAVAAAAGGHLEFVKSLQAWGIDITATPKGKNSPLSEACRFGQAGVVDYLLAEGASPTSSDGSGHNFDLIDLAGGLARKQIVTSLQARRQQVSEKNQE